MPTPDDSQTTPSSLTNRTLVALIRVLSKMPLGLLYLLADGLYLTLYHGLRYQRGLLLDNLRGAFPDLPPAQLTTLAQKNYRQSIQILFETVKALDMKPATLLEHVHFDNPEVMRKYLNTNQPVLAVAAHQCNWEWLQLACSACFETPLDAIYKTLNHPPLDRLLQQLRSRFGSRLVPADNVLAELLKQKNGARIVALVADQGPRPDEKKVWLNYLGRDTAFYAGTEQIARLLKAPVVFVHMRRSDRGQYRIQFETLVESPRDTAAGEIMRRYVRALEKQTREAPADWLWLYKRWKYRRTVYD